MRRKLVYCGARASELKVSLGDKWEVIEASEPGEVQNLAMQEAAEVGVVELEVDDDHYVRRVEESIAGTGYTQWIALVNESPLESDQLASLVSNHFYDYHTLPLDKRRFLYCVGHACGMAEIQKKSRYHSEHRTDEFSNIVGVSPVMHHLFRQMKKVVKCDSSVLLRGESGTGKELVAQEIHRNSLRASGPIVEVNCGSLPEKLIQSELFGHEKGAFTGAVSRKIGKIEMASGGTVFLDEIGDLPYEAQVNLLRFLQEGTIERVGGTETIKVDVRVIAATHVDLEKAIEEGRFREDLYYRLNVLTLQIPPLRERDGDIELLAHYFLEKYAFHHHRDVRGFSKQAIAGLRRYHWPGNVRELMNRVKRVVIMSEGKLITAADLGLDKNGVNCMRQTLDAVRANAECHAIKDALYRSNNNITEASKMLGVSRVTLYRLLEKHNMSPV